MFDQSVEHAEMADGNIITPNSKRFCQVKKNPKIREKLGSGWVGKVATRIFFFYYFFFFLLFLLYMSQKK